MSLLLELEIDVVSKLQKKQEDKLRGWEKERRHRKGIAPEWSAQRCCLPWARASLTLFPLSSSRRGNVARESMSSDPNLFNASACVKSHTMQSAIKPNLTTCPCFAPFYGSRCEHTYLIPHYLMFDITPIDMRGHQGTCQGNRKPNRPLLTSTA